VSSSTSSRKGKEEKGRGGRVEGKGEREEGRSGTKG